MSTLHISNLPQDATERECKRMSFLTNCKPLVAIIRTSLKVVVTVLLLSNESLNKKQTDIFFPFQGFQKVTLKTAPRGDVYGFAVFESSTDASEARRMLDGYPFEKDGKSLKVEFSKKGGKRREDNNDRRRDDRDFGNNNRDRDNDNNNRGRGNRDFDNNRERNWDRNDNNNTNNNSDWDRRGNNNNNKDWDTNRGRNDNNDRRGGRRDY